MTEVTPDQVIAVANAGAGPLSDLAKQAGTAFALTAEEAKNFGAGFVPDLLRMAGVPPEPPEPEPEPYSTLVKNISNANPAVVTVDSAEYPNFGVGIVTRYEGTGSALLDDPEATFTVASINGVGRTFSIPANLTSEAAALKTGTVFIVPQAAKTAKVRQSPPKAAKTILTDPPPKPEKLKPQIPNGYENEAKEEPQWQAQQKSPKSVKAEPLRSPTTTAK